MNIQVHLVSTQHLDCIVANSGYNQGSHQSYKDCWDCMLDLKGNKMEMLVNMMVMLGCNWGTLGCMDWLETVLDCSGNKLGTGCILLMKDCN